MLVFPLKKNTSIREIFPKKKITLVNLLRSLCPIPTLTLFWYHRNNGRNFGFPLKSAASSTCVSLPSEQDCLAKTRLHQIDPQAHGFGTCRSLDLRKKKTGMGGWSGDGRRKVDGLCFKVRNESNEIPTTFMAQPRYIISMSMLVGEMTNMIEVP